jgi:hypothetical protein
MLMVGAVEGNCDIEILSLLGVEIIYVLCGRRNEEVVMQASLERIARLEKELQEARQALWREDAERYRVLVREMSEEDRQRIVGNLTDRGERVLFGLEAPEEPKRAGVRPGGAGGDLTCAVCGKRGLTELGLKLHTARMHKPGKEGQEIEAA